MLNYVGLFRYFNVLELKFLFLLKTSLTCETESSRSPKKKKKKKEQIKLANEVCKAKDSYG